MRLLRQALAQAVEVLADQVLRFLAHGAGHKPSILFQPYQAAFTDEAFGFNRHARGDVFSRLRQTVNVAAQHEGYHEGNAQHGDHHARLKPSDQSFGDFLRKGVQRGAVGALKLSTVRKDYKSVCLGNTR